MAGGSERKEGSILARPDGTFVRVTAGVDEVFTPRPARDAPELRQLLGLRDVLTEVLALQASTYGEPPGLQAAQRRLNDRYDAYLRRYEPLNRFHLAPAGRPVTGDGEESVRRVEPAMGGFRRDPDFPVVMALELFDPDTQTARKAPIFTTRVVAPRHRPLGAESAQDALALCLDERGEVDLGVVARLLGVDTATARTELGELVWEEPGTDGLVTREVYLSGNVRTKLAAAEAAAADDPPMADQCRGAALGAASGPRARRNRRTPGRHLDRRE